VTLDALIGVAGKFSDKDLENVYEKLIQGIEYAYVNGYEEGMVLYLASPYCDENSAPKGWLKNKHALQLLMKMFPNNFVYYVADNSLRNEEKILYSPNGQPITEERIAKIDKTYEEGKK